MNYRKALLTVITLLIPATGMTLSTDRDQPATIEADEVEMDFKTGVRTYKGNVVVVQGTLRIVGDKLIVNYKDDQFETATAWGNPAEFKQRPDGKDQDVIGKGRKILLNQVNNTLTLYTSASLKQAGDTAIGEEIIYNMETDKMTVKSVGPGGAKTKKAEGEKPAEKKRARIVIIPKKQTATPGKTAGDSKTPVKTTADPKTPGKTAADPDTPAKTDPKK